MRKAFRLGRAVANRGGIRFRDGYLHLAEVAFAEGPRLVRAVLRDVEGRGAGRDGERELGGWVRSVVQDEGFRMRKVSAVIDDESVYVRNVELPASALSRGRTALAYAVEPFLPYPVAESILQVRPIERPRSGTTRAVLVAVKRRCVDAIAGLLRAANLDVGQLDVPSYALARAYLAGREAADGGGKEAPVLLAEAGPEGLHLAAVREGTVSLARVVRPPEGRTLREIAGAEIRFTVKAFQDLFPLDPAPRLLVAGSEKIVSEVLVMSLAAGVEGTRFDLFDYVPPLNGLLDERAKRELGGVAGAAVGMAVARGGS